MERSLVTVQAIQPTHIFNTRLIQTIVASQNRSNKKKTLKHTGKGELTMCRALEKFFIYTQLWQHCTLSTYIHTCVVARISQALT